MAPTMTTTARLGLPVPTDAGTPNIIHDFTAIMTLIMDAVDTDTLGFLEGTHSARPAAGISNRMYHETDSGSWFMDSGTAWVQVAGSRVSNRAHSWTLPDATSIDPTSSKVASFPIWPASGEAVQLIGALILCDSQGAVPSTFKLQTDHAAHGTYADVTLTGSTVTLTPNTGAYVFVATASALTMAAGDGVRIVATNPGTGTSKGLEVAPVTQHTI